MNELIIIGAGPVGLYAAFLAGLRNLKTIVLESNHEVGGRLVSNYSNKFIYDIAGIPAITAGDYIKQAYQQYSRFVESIPIYLDNEVLDIKKLDDHYEIITNQGHYQTKTVLITHGGGGFVPIRLTDKIYENVYYTTPDLSIFKDQKTLIFGGGDSAFDCANELLKVTSDVTIVHRRQEFRALAGSVTNFINQGGKVLTPYVAQDFVGGKVLEKIKLRNVTDHSECEVLCDKVVVNFGFSLTNPKLEQWHIFGEKGLIKVNTTMQTNQIGIYAAGDGVTYPGKVKLIATGVGEAATAINSVVNLLYPERQLVHSSTILDPQ